MSFASAVCPNETAAENIREQVEFLKRKRRMKGRPQTFLAISSKVTKGTKNECLLSPTTHSHLNSNIKFKYTKRRKLNSIRSAMSNSVSKVQTYERVIKNKNKDYLL